MNPTFVSCGAVRRLLLVMLCGALSACGGIAYHLPEHSAERMSVPQTMRPGEQRLALSTPARLPAPGGFEMGLASEDPDVVTVVVREGGMGATESSLLARASGRTRVHYVNRFALPRDSSLRIPLDTLQAVSLGSFAVTVK
ncbi:MULTISPECIES: hypothetical protein [Niveibacterium]|uniref:Uncharacterized protein n=1 Tax=Niveibacterium microcysteis TaxID=2811415 RepID=A0ABX7M518_9RHOO|nr:MULTISPECIES: hypothetical protein [Niveibacterium]QSI76869.1 hypothetical protein JY500_20870 [Niveibacterium microcysteis]